MTSGTAADDPLLELISEMIGIETHRLTDERSLFHDFGVAGDDGADLLEAIRLRFELDVSQVNSDRYFGPEASFSLINASWCLIRGQRLDADIVRLRISDLRRSIAAGRWIEPSG